MEILITAKGKDLKAMTDLHFGRAEGFILYNTDSGEMTYHSNQQNVQASHGAGIQAAQNVAKLGAKVVLTGQTGPKATQALKAANIQVYSVGDNEISVEDAISKFKNDELKQI